MKQGDDTMIRHVSREEQAFGHRGLKRSESPKKFIPKKPARNDIGRNITVTIVKRLHDVVGPVRDADR